MTQKAAKFQNPWVQNSPCSLLSSTGPNISFPFAGVPSTQDTQQFLRLHTANRSRVLFPNCGEKSRAVAQIWGHIHTLLKHSQEREKWDTWGSRPGYLGYDHITAIWKELVRWTEFQALEQGRNLYLPNHREREGKNNSERKQGLCYQLEGMVAKRQVKATDVHATYCPLLTTGITRPRDI